jgi:hypothetical protein
MLKQLPERSVRFLREYDVQSSTPSGTSAVNVTNTRPCITYTFRIWTNSGSLIPLDHFTYEWNGDEEGEESDVKYEDDEVDEDDLLVDDDKPASDGQLQVPDEGERQCKKPKLAQGSGCQAEPAV